MIQVENITKYFGEMLLYKELSLTVYEGARIALVAKNGAGKTTLLNIIAGTESPDSGDVVFRNDIAVGYLQQDPPLPEGKRVEDAIYHTDGELGRTVMEYDHAVTLGDSEKIMELSERMDALGGWDFESRAKNILSKLNIDNLDNDVSTLSGGQRKRLALAMVLIENPNVLILDEPTNHLDLEMASWLEDYLISSGKTIFMVTHDRYFLDRVCTDIYELDHGTLYTYKGGYNDYLRKKEERIELFNTEVDKAQNIYRRELEWMRRMPQARGHKAKYRQDAFYDTKEKAFQRRDDGRVSIGIESSRLGTKIFEAKNISKSFGNKHLFTDFSYTFARYDKLGIIGKNGTGKSTFLNIITGAMQPDSGIVDIGDSVKFGYFRQQGISFNDNQRVIDAVKAIAEVVTLSDGKTITASQFLTQFLFTPESQYSYIHKLSGGEKRRLYLLTILMQSPNFLVLDEPTNDLDIMTMNVLEEYLENYNGCVIVVSHDRYFMDKVVGQLLVFEGDGKVTNFAGNYTQYRNKIEEQEALQQLQSKDTNKENRDTRKDNPRNQSASRKMSYKEQREFETLEQEIATLSTEKNTIEELLSGGALSGEEITVSSARYAELTASLDEKELRWLELSEI